MHLQQKINKISKVFNIEDVSSIIPDKKYIQKYYKINKIPYSLFHTYSDLIYMGISRDGKFKRSDLLAHARLVNEYIGESEKENGSISDGKVQNVLELACGRGANTSYLARQQPEVYFYGIDISEGQLYFARKKSKKLKNFTPTIGDYHDLSKFGSDFFDVVFVVEALCYSTQKEKVLSEVFRVLKKGGKFIIFDGYLNKLEANLNEIEQKACKLTERGMAVSKFEIY